jgi:hypothetical protein
MGASDGLAQRQRRTRLPPWLALKEEEIMTTTVLGVSG